MRILVFGDSMVYGSWDSMGGWCDRLKQYYHAKTIQSNGSFKTQVLNMGIGGDDSRKLLGRIHEESLARESNSWPFTFIIAIGYNDSRTTDGGSEAQVSETEFADNLRKITEIARGFTSRVILVGLTPLAQPVIRFKQYEYTNERILRYEQIITEVANDHAVTKVTLYDLVQPFTHELLSTDGLHLNDKGHFLVYEHVRREIEKIIYEESLAAK